jgi:hypothetical protein
MSRLRARLARLARRPAPAEPTDATARELRIERARTRAWAERVAALGRSAGAQESILAALLATEDAALRLAARASAIGVPAEGAARPELRRSGGRPPLLH